jgi:hypothetical protein
MIDYDAAEKALEFLKSTDQEAGRRKAYANALDDMKKTVLAMTYNELKEGSAADRLKKSEGHPDYQSHLEKLRQANEDYHVMNNQRITAATQIEMWRSVNSNQRKGNI